MMPAPRPWLIVSLALAASTLLLAERAEAQRFGGRTGGGGFSGTRPGGGVSGGISGTRPGGGISGNFSGTRPGGGISGNFSGTRPGTFSGTQPGTFSGTRPGTVTGTQPGAFSGNPPGAFTGNPPNNARGGIVVPGDPFTPPTTRPATSNRPPSVELSEDAKSGARTVGATMIVGGVGTLLFGLLILGSVGFLVVQSVRSSVPVPTKRRKRD